MLTLTVCFLKVKMHLTILEVFSDRYISNTLLQADNRSVGFARRRPVLDAQLAFRFGPQAVGAQLQQPCVPGQAASSRRTAARRMDRLSARL